MRILELGSGPGQLAREILSHCDVQTYVALDFSTAMHEIATEHLGALRHDEGNMALWSGMNPPSSPFSSGLVMTP